MQKLGVQVKAARAAVREMFPSSSQPAAQPPPESAAAREAIRGAEMLARRV